MGVGEPGSWATRAASLNASSAPAGTSPFAHREMRGCGIPERLEISSCDMPLSRRRRMRSDVSLMPPMYAMSHSMSMPHRSMRRCIFDGVKPYLLIAALMRQQNTGPLPVAKAIGQVKLQSHFQKFKSGQVDEPARTTAAPLAKYFDIPIEAIYDEKIAGQIARERGLVALARDIEREPIPERAPRKRVSMKSPRLAAVDTQPDGRLDWPFSAALRARMATLTPSGMAIVEGAIVAAIEHAIQGGHAKRRSA